MSLSKKRNFSDYFIDTKIFLEGSYLTNKTMSTFINNFLPKNQPFNIEPWLYDGNESVSSIPNSQIVDWILVSLKINPTDLESVARRAGFLKKDGHIVDLDGENPLRFSTNLGNYFIQIEHRNHLKVMSANSILLE